MSVPAPAWVVAGPPGAGKSTVARLLLARLDPVPALLDKDTIYGAFVAATLDAGGPSAGRARGPVVRRPRQGPRVRRDDRDRPRDPLHGCPVLLSGPFTQQIHDAGRWRSWVDGLGGGTVRLVWVRSDAATLRGRLTARGSGRDTGKLADFAAFTARMRLDNIPAVPHTVIDNRLTAPVPLEDQIAALVAPRLRLPGRYVPRNAATAPRDVARWPPGTFPLWPFGP